MDFEQEPLRKIQAFGDRLKISLGADLPADSADYLARMQSAAARMQKMITDLLAYARVSTRIQPPQPVDLHALVEEVVTDLVIRIEESGGQVQVGELPTIAADPLQMRQLFQNLIGNSLKFHRPGIPPVVRVESAKPETPGQNGRLVHVVVCDNGIGFDDSYAERIFQPFQRLVSRAEFEGTGMGLAICRKIVERHCGSLTARSLPEGGACFSITLPRDLPAEVASPVGSAPCAEE